MPEIRIAPSKFPACTPRCIWLATASTHSALTVPGVPAFPHFCHTQKVAWCVTHAFADLHDLYVERFDRNDPTRCEFKGDWEKATVRREKITVRDAEDVEIDVTVTRHGPIIAGAPESGHAIALRSVQIDRIDRSLDCLVPMLKAPSLEAFYEATRGWGVIDHNLVAADTDGHIGVLIRAIVPDRDRANGWLPVPGWTGDHEWRGDIPFERMPREIDPPAGFIVTANNRPVPDDHPDYICTDCHPSTRAHRIAARIEAGASTIGDMEEILRDAWSARAVDICAEITSVKPGNPAARALVDGLAGWDGAMMPGLLAPSIYTLVRQEMTRILARRSGLDAASNDMLASVSPGIPALNQLWWTLPNLLRAGDTSLLDGATWHDVILEALETVPGATGRNHGAACTGRFRASAGRRVSRRQAGSGAVVGPRGRRRRLRFRHRRLPDRRHARHLWFGCALRVRSVRLGQEPLGRLPRNVGPSRPQTLQRPERALGARRTRSRALYAGCRGGQRSLRLRICAPKGHQAQRDSNEKRERNDVSLNLHTTASCGTIVNRTDSR